jgi:hypothetical protein
MSVLLLRRLGGPLADRPHRGGFGPTTAPTIGVLPLHETGLWPARPDQLVCLVSDDDLVRTRGLAAVERNRANGNHPVAEPDWPLTAAGLLLTALVAGCDDRKSEADAIGSAIRAMPGMSDVNWEYSNGTDNNPSFNMYVTVEPASTAQQASDAGRTFVHRVGYAGRRASCATWSAC